MTATKVRIHVSLPEMGHKQSIAVPEMEFPSFREAVVATCGRLTVLADVDPELSEQVQVSIVTGHEGIPGYRVYASEWGPALEEAAFLRETFSIQPPAERPEQ